VRTTAARPGSAATSTRAENHPPTPRRIGSSMTPLVRGRRSRAPARSVVRMFLRVSVTRTEPRRSVSVTLPRLTRSTSSMRRRVTRRTRGGPSTTRRTTRPGARTTTTTPMRIRTATPAPPRARVVSRTRASWSPGSARRGGRDVTVSVRLVPGGTTTWAGRTLSHVTAARGMSRGATCGLPRRSSRKPARPTSTTTGLFPGFASAIAARCEPANSTRVGVAVRARTGREALASAEADASESTARTAAARRLTDRSP